MNKIKIANVLISDSWGEVTPDALERGIGGREGAMVYLSRAWADNGHQVTNFVNVTKSSRFEGHYGFSDREGFHEYVPLHTTKAVLNNFPYDVVIAWECPSLFSDQNIMAKLKMCEMQVCHFTEGEMEAAEKYCDYVAALSPWHKGFMISSGLAMRQGDDHVVVFPNGVDISRYPKREVEKKYDYRTPEMSPKFVYSSSPDRALWQLLQSWPYIRKSFPGATLKVGYGVKNWTDKLKWAHNRQGEQALQIEELMKQDGIKDIGKVGQGDLSKMQIEATAWLYPLDAIQATESGCITAVENAAAGNPIITTDCDCMPEEFGGIGVINELPFDAEGFAESVEYVLAKPSLVQELRMEGREFAEGRHWSLIAQQWTNFVEEKIA